MAPHRALAVSDILHEVFKHLSIRPQLSLPGALADLGSFEFPDELTDWDDFQDSEAKKLTLARAARTCKVFAEPASAILWEVIDDFAPIASVLRNAHERISEGGEEARVWERIEQIARRIRALVTWMHTAGDASDDSERLAAFCSHFDGGGRPMFPNLRVLRVLLGNTTAVWLSFLRAACASPSLAFVMVATGDELTILKVLAGAAVAPQQIVHFHMSLLSSLDEEGHRAVAKFSNLHTAYFMAIDATLFRHLASLPNLQVLHGRFTVLPAEIVDMRGAFPALQELHTEYMGQGAQRRVLSVLPVISSSSLATLSLCDSVPRTEDMVQYLNDLSSSPIIARLRRLTLFVDIEFNEIFDQGEVPDGVSLAPNVLAPLKPLSALTDLSFVVCFQTPTVATFAVSDEDLDAVASAWPRLVSAKVGYTIQWDPWPGDEHRSPRGITRPSLSAVVALAERCRNLERLNIEFENVGECELARLEARADACASPQTALRRLVFDANADFCRVLRLEDPRRLAVALRRLFPNLRSGLEMVQPPKGESGEGSVWYRGWSARDMDTDAARLLEALDDVRLRVDGHL